MGCDIHAYVEHRKPGDDQWWGFPRINPGRDYGIFGRLAGVRGGKALVEPRGVPVPLGWYSSTDWWVLIDEKYAGEEGWCSLDDARRWSAHGPAIQERDGKPWRVKHPDWHTPSWLTVEEFERAVTEAGSWEAEPEYWAVLGAMKMLAVRGQEVRLVFWFDN